MVDGELLELWGVEEQLGQIDRCCRVIAAVGETKTVKEPIESIWFGSPLRNLR